MALGASGPFTIADGPMCAAVRPVDGVSVRPRRS